MTLGEIASRLGGRVAGDPQVLIRQVGSLEHAGPGQITFLASSKHSAKLARLFRALLVGSRFSTIAESSSAIVP